MSADGKLVASSSNDGTVRLWDAATGKELHLFKEGGEVRSVRFAAGDRVLICSSIEKVYPKGKEPWESELTYRLTWYDVAKRKQILQLRSDAPLAVEVLADSKWVLTVCEVNTDTQFQLREAATGKLVRVTTHVLRGTHGFVISPDGKRFAGWTDEGRVEVWDLATGKVIQGFEAKRGSSGIVFSADGNRLAMGGQGEPIAIYDLKAKKEIMSSIYHSNGVLLFARGGKWLVNAHLGMIMVLDASTGERVPGLLMMPHREICSMALSRDGKVLVAGCRETRRVSVWKVAELK